MIEVKSITSKYGTALLSDGYWVISRGNKKNYKKKLHRLIYEDYHKCTLLPNAIIHHKDRNKTNNRIENLELMDRPTHIKLHHTNAKRSRETSINISNARKNIPCSPEHKLKNSTTLNTTGFFRVTIGMCNSCKNGFIWEYQHCIGGKQKKIRATDLIRLKQKVLNNGLDWFVVNENNALLTCEKYEYPLMELM